MRSHPSLAVHERRAILLADDAQELIEGVEGIYRHPSAGEILYLDRLSLQKISQINAHGKSDISPR